MNQAVSSADTERFRKAIVRCLGLQFDDGRLGLLADVLRRRLDVVKRPADAYLATLEREGPDDEVVHSRRS